MTSGKKSSADALSTLKHCCKMNMYSMRISGKSTVIDGFPNTYVRVQAEEVKPGEREFVHRVVLIGENQVYSGVGWVVDGDSDACMSCHSKFGIMVWRHHCRMCGNTICNSCSPHRVDLKDECNLEENGASRVCNQCYVDLHFRMAKLNDGESEKVGASNSILHETPTFGGKTTKQSTKGMMMPVHSSSGLMNPKSILKTTNVTNDNIDGQGKDQGVSPVTALLNNLDGRWDRSDDGISTPGSLTATESQRCTPEETLSKTSIQSVPNSAKSTATDKYFFTPNSAREMGFIASGGTSEKTNKWKDSGASSTDRKVLGDVNQEKLSPISGMNGKFSSSSSVLLKKTIEGSHGRSKLIVEDGENLGTNYSPLPETPNSVVSSPKKSNLSSRFVPVPSFVIKSVIDNYKGLLGSNKTVYVNVCKHGSVPVPTSKQLRSTNISVSYVVGELKELSREGEAVLCVDVCYHNQVHVWAYADENGMNLSALAEHAVVCVNRHHHLNMWISSLPQYTTYQGNVKPMMMNVQHGNPDSVGVGA